MLGTIRKIRSRPILKGTDRENRCFFTSINYFDALIHIKICPTSVVVLIIIVKEFPFYYAPLLIFQLFNKGLLKSKFVDQYVLKKMVMTSPTKQVQLDGESLTMEQKLNIEVIPNCLNIIGNI